MKKLLSILLAVLVLGACGTATMEAKKKAPRKAKAKTTAVSTNKIAKDVNDYCDAIREAIAQEIPIGSSTGYNFANSSLASRIAKYKKAGKLTPEQQRIYRLFREWENSNF